jgi:hypothetical protein
MKGIISEILPVASSSEFSLISMKEIISEILLYEEEESVRSYQWQVLLNFH